MTYLLDTSACVGMLRGKAPKSRARMDHVGKHECAISVVVFELQTGALKSARSSEELSKVANLVGEMRSLGFDDECARVAAEIRVELEQRGLPIGPFDSLIAGIARRHDLTVVTRNLEEYSRVKDLRVEDWEA